MRSTTMPPDSFRVGVYSILPARNQVIGPEGRQKIEPRVMQVLLCLAARAGDVVSREQILQEVWLDSVVSDEVLTVAIQKLRRVLGDDAKDARFIQTVPGRGYRLNELTREPAGTQQETARPSRASLSWKAMLWAGALMVGALASILFSRGSPPRVDTRQPARIAIHPPPEAVAESFVISPDGRKLAFIAPNADGVDSIWVRELESGSTELLAGTENVWQLLWSPDSLRIGFGAASQLKRVSLSGGTPETVSETPFRGGSWSDDDLLVFTGAWGKLFRMAADGGEPTPLAVEDGLGGDVYRACPSFLPDNSHFLYLAYDAFERGRIFVGSLESPKSVFVVESDSPAHYDAGHLLFVRSGVVHAQPFDTEKLMLYGEPKVLGAQLMSAEVGGTRTSLSVSRNGILALRGGSAPAGQLVWYDREGRELARIPQPASGEYVNPSLSPDGRTIAANRRDPATGNVDIWLIDVESSRASRFTTAPSFETDLVWSPDGERVAYGAYRDGQHGVWLQSAGGGNETLLWQVPRELVYGAIPTDWSRRDIVLVDLTNFRFGSWAVPVSGETEPRPVVDAGSPGWGAHLSPNGKWLAYSSTETGTYEVFVMGFPDGTNKKRISLHGGTHPRWRQDGKELFFWGGANRVGTVMRVDVAEEAFT
ncbi:MAG TPA: winged helix-turn-helix domain-containing protein, partial [Vicinamibacteria bacterium]|nr:winged helix-turn-helix domain-containing protein [Vicinamibacteria bacterium]